MSARVIKSLDNRPFETLFNNSEFQDKFFVKSRSRGKGLTREAARRKIRLRDKLCRYCGIAESVTVDHIIPRSKGGPNAQSNLVGCCRECNQLKADRTPDEAGMVLLPERKLP